MKGHWNHLKEERQEWKSEEEDAYVLIVTLICFNKCSKNYYYLFTWFSKCGPRFTVSASPESLLEMRISESHSRPAELETLGKGPTFHFLTSSLGDSRHANVWKITKVQIPTFIHRTKRIEKLCSDSSSESKWTYMCWFTLQVLFYHTNWELVSNLLVILHDNYCSSLNSTYPIYLISLMAVIMNMYTILRNLNRLKDFWIFSSQSSIMLHLTIWFLKPKIFLHL